MPVLERIEITSSAQYAEELASQSLETHRIPDPFSYSLINNELFSPTKHTRITDEVKDKTSSLGALEYQAVLSIEEWAAKNDKGAIIWISPPHPGVYPVLKIIVSEIEYKNNARRLFNRAILFDFDESQCMKFAWNLTSFSQNKPVFTNLDQIRATPLILDTKDKSWIEILEGLIYDSGLWESIRQGEDRTSKNKALERARMIQKELFFSQKPIPYEEAEMAARQMMGPHRGSCPPKNTIGKTALGVFSENSLTYSGSSLEPDQYGSLEFECPHEGCHKMNRRPRGQLIPNCQHCGKNVRC